MPTEVQQRDFALAEQRPLLRFDARPESCGNGICLDFGDFQVDINGLPEERLLDFLAAADGSLTVKEIADRLELPVGPVTALCEQLRDAGSLVAASAEDSAVIPAAEVAATCYSVFPAWKDRLFSHRLWRSLADGSAPREVFCGWLIECYHFIEGVTVRLPEVIAHCRDVEVRRHFVQHFAEEYDHHHFFQRALTEIGISAEQAQGTTPLPGTSAILNHMRDCGRRDPLCYAACSGFLEATGANHRQAQQFFESVKKHFDDRGGNIIGPLAAHAELDEKYQHSGVLSDVCEALGTVTRSRADAALQAAYTLLETLELWSTDIDRHYRLTDGRQRGVRRYRPAF